MLEILWYCICLFTSCLFTGLAFVGFLVEFLCENVPIIKICNALVRSLYLAETVKEVSVNTVECTEGAGQKGEFRPWLCSQVTVSSSSGSSLTLSALSCKVGLRLVDVRIKWDNACGADYIVCVCSSEDSRWHWYHSFIHGSYRIVSGEAFNDQIVIYIDLIC